jgi:hypothetical protein
MISINRVVLTLRSVSDPKISMEVVLNLFVFSRGKFRENLHIGIIYTIFK